MKKQIMSLGLLLTSIASLNIAVAYTPEEKSSAEFLAGKKIILTQKNVNDYSLDKKITRREMAKVTLNLSEKKIGIACSGLFVDVKKGDWGCKYAEAGVKYNFFASNKNFNPDNSISKIEALKMVMKGTSIEKNDSSDWRKGYVTSAVENGLLQTAFTNYNTPATRGWIFTLAKNGMTYDKTKKPAIIKKEDKNELIDDGEIIDEDMKLIEELLNI